MTGWPPPQGQPPPPGPQPPVQELSQRRKGMYALIPIALISAFILYMIYQMDELSNAAYIAERHCSNVVESDDSLLIGVSSWDRDCRGAAFLALREFGFSETVANSTLDSNGIGSTRAGDWQVVSIKEDYGWLVAVGPRDK